MSEAGRIGPLPRERLPAARLGIDARKTTPEKDLFTVVRGKSLLPAA